MKRFFCLLAMFSLFGCFKKKASAPTIETWLEAHFPGQLLVLDKNRNLNVVDFISGGKKTAVVADKADPDVQFTLDWRKSDPNLGLDTTFVFEKLNSCRTDVGHARELLSSLKNHGLQAVSVGIIDAAAFIQVYSEPGPAFREQILQAIVNALNAGSAPGQTSFWVEIMEPNVYHTEFQDIIPRAHWQRPGSWQDDYKLLSLNFERKEKMLVNNLAKGWALNLYAKRNSAYREGAFPLALALAEKKLPEPFYLEPDQMVEFSLDTKDPMSILFGFPYYKTKPAEDTRPEPEGHVFAMYQTDRQTYLVFIK